MIRPVSLAVLLLCSAGQARAAGELLGVGVGHPAPAAAGNSIAFTALADGTVGGAPVAGSGTYAGAAPSSLSSATWGGGCSGSSTVSSFSAGAGTWSASFTVPGSAGTGCTIAVTDDLSDNATSPGVTISAGGFSGPLDVISGGAAATVVGCYGFTACSAAIAAAATQPLWQYGSNSDHRCDVLVTASGAPATVTSNCSTGAEDGTDLATWCAGAGAGCFVRTLYKQSGSGSDFTETVGGLAPTAGLTSGPSGANVAAIFSGGQDLGNGSITISQPFTIAAVAYHTGGTAVGPFIISAVGVSYTGTGANNTANTCYQYAGGGASTVVTCSDDVWHSAISVFDGASSTMKIDGASPTATPDTGTSALSPGDYIGGFTGGGSLTGRIAFMILFSSGLSTGDQTALNSNFHTIMGF